MTDNRLHPIHSEVGPSSIADIILCPGRVRMCRGLERKASFAAAQGTIAHTFAELILTGKSAFKAGEVIIQEGFEITVDLDMIGAVEQYLSHIADIKVSAYGMASTESIETHGSLACVGIPEVFGTADYSLSIPFNTLYVRDYKHGAGVIVDAEENPQLMCYALIAAQDMIVAHDVIDIGIVQPRGMYGDAIKTWQTTPDFILNWAETVLKPAVRLALSDDAPLIPGDKQCRFCPAKAHCPAVATHVLKTAQADFKGFTSFEPDRLDKLTIGDIEAIYPRLSLISDWIKGIEARVYSTLSSGDTVAGYKLVAGRSSRSWADEDEAAEFLQAHDIEPFEKKMLSPAQAEKLLDKETKKEVNTLTVKSEGKPTIVPSTDKRAAITTASTDFQNYI